MDIEKLNPFHYSEWLELYKGYAKFYKTVLCEEGTKMSWAWLMDKEHPCTGIVAVKDKKLIGFAHFRAMPSLLRGHDIGFLDDLFITPSARGGDAASLLLAAVKKEAVDNGWDVVRWITRDNNYRARNLYDKIAEKTDWDTYEMQA